MARQSSLFEPAGASALEASVGWIGDLVLGGVAVSLCVLAVALVGMLMLSGRMAWREGARVVLGCFVLLGAPVIARGVFSFDRSGEAELSSAPPVDQALPRDLPIAEYNPYAQASVRDDR